MTDVSTTRRKSMTPTRRLKIFEQHHGVCCLCNMKIDGVREPWIVEHLICLGLGAPDADDNCAPAHETCRREKDKIDMAMIAKAKRNKARHIGITAPKQKIKSAGFPKRKRTHEGRPSLPPRNLYERTE